VDSLKAVVIIEFSTDGHNFIVLERHQGRRPAGRFVARRFDVAIEFVATDMAGAARMMTGD
jgi:hypothetical protein